MKIRGRLATYECKWQQSGITFAKAVVRKAKVIPAKKFLGFTIVREHTVYIQVWESIYAVRMCTVQYATPEHLYKWFREAVEEYENYAEAWANNPYGD